MIKIENAREQMWLPLEYVAFENGLLGRTEIDDDFTVTAIPMSQPKPPSRDDPMESIQFNGIDAYLVMKRKFQVIENNVIALQISF